MQRLRDALARATAVPPAHPVDWRVVAAAAVLALAAWAWTRWFLPWGLVAGDALEFASIARRLAEGEGFTTGVLFPAELSFGVTADHPSLMRAPLWPLMTAGLFALFGPETWAVHAAVAASFSATAALGAALAMRLAGTLAGVVAGVAIATAPQLRVFTVDGMSEALFAALVLLVFTLCAVRARPLWIGAACGLAYLARYNGGILLPAALALVALRPKPGRALVLCAAGFLAVAAPWWIRNWIVTGNPFFTLYSVGPFLRPRVWHPNTHLVFHLEPELHEAARFSPWRKLGILLPKILAHFPFASANLAAFAGVVLACAKRERLAIAFALVAAATTLVIALMLANGRYFVPFFPTMIALGAAAWTLHGGRLRAAALALLLAAPILPSFPPELEDITLLRGTVAGLRARAGGAAASPSGAEERLAGLRRCLEGRPVVLAEDAARLSWDADVISIHLPATRRDFWRIVDEYPVEFVQLRRYRRVSPEDLAPRFAPRPDCAPDLYERSGR